VKPRLYLHIGRPKVGSTAIQTLLHENREHLSTCGFLYPQSVMHKNASHKLALVFQPRLRDAASVSDCSAEEIYDALYREAVDVGLPRIVASTENLFLIHPARLAPMLKSRFDTTIICYLRRQDHVLASSLIQEIKDGAVTPDVDVAAYAGFPKRLEYLDYNLILGRWAEAFGADKIVVRVMEPSQLRGSLYEDFLHVLGLESDGFKAPRAKANPSPALDALEFIRLIDDTAGVGMMSRSQLHQFVLSASEQNGNCGSYDSTSLISNAIRHRLLAQFRESNASVAKRFLGRDNGVLFEDTTVPDAAESKYSGLDLTRFARMVASVVTNQQRQIVRLQNRVRDLEQGKQR
jgi:hypothetical protein